MKLSPIGCSHAPVPGGRCSACPPSTHTTNIDLWSIRSCMRRPCCAGHVSRARGAPSSRRIIAVAKGRVAAYTLAISMGRFLQMQRSWAWQAAEAVLRTRRVQVGQVVDLNSSVWRAPAAALNQHHWTTHVFESRLQGAACAKSNAATNAANEACDGND
jgi:hypothetical protein